MTSEFEEDSYSARSGCTLFLRRNGLQMIALGIVLVALLWWLSQKLGGLFWFGF